MKSIAAILVIVLLGLFVLPCADDNDNIAFLSDVHTSQTNHEHDTNDRCSPFCSCSCCGIAMNSFHFSTLTFYTPILPIPVAKKMVLRNESFTTYYLGSIWQPPQSIV